MKTFSDLEFEARDIGSKQSRIMFPNGYGVSVVQGWFSYGGDQGLYELAVLDADGALTYETPVTDDVVGWLSEDAVTELMLKVQQLEAELA
jgi:hypothetical protein